MNKKESEIIVKVLISVFFGALTFLPFLWFGGDVIIFGPDSLWQLDYGRVLSDTLSLWKGSVSFGYGWSDVNSLPHTLIVIILESLGFSYPIIQKMIISLLIFITSYVTYALFLEVANDRSLKIKIFALVSAVLYTINPFALTWVWWRFLWVIYIYPVWPIAFLILIKLLKNTLTIRQGIIFSLFLLFFSPGIGALVMSFILFISLCVFSIAYLFIGGRMIDFRSFLSRVTLFAAIIVLINIWWLLPGVMMIHNSISNALTAYDPVLALQYTSTNSNVLNVMTLWGNRPLYDTFYGEGYYGKTITNIMQFPVFPFFQLAPLFLVLLFLSKVKHSSDRYLKVIIFSVLVLFFFGIFLTKGLNAPLESVNLFFLKLPIIGAAFRVPYDKFGYIIAFSISLLIPLGLRYFYEKSHERLLYVYGGVLFMYFIFLFSIVFSTDFLPKDQNKLKGILASVPSEYEELRGLNLNEDDKILILPPANASESSYVWENGVQPNGKDIISDYVSSKVIFLPNGNASSDLMLDGLNDNLFVEQNSSDDFKKTLHWLGINYIFIHKDWNSGFMANKVRPPGDYFEYVSKLDELDIVMDNKYFTLYRVGKSVPKFTFIADNVVGTNKPSIDSYIKVSSLMGEKISFVDSEISDNKIQTIDKNNLSTISESTSVFAVPLFADEVNYLFVRDSQVNLNGIGSINNVPVGNGIAGLYNYWPIIPSSKSIDIFVNNLAQSNSIIASDPQIHDPDKWKSQDWECYPKNKDAVLFEKSNFINLLSQEQATTCFMIILGEYPDSSQVLLKFDYISDKGTNPKALVLSDDTKGNSKIIYKNEYKSLTDPKTEIISFIAEKGVRYRLFVYSDKTSQGGLNFKLSNFGISAIDQNLFKKILIKNSSNLSSDNSFQKDINFLKINSTKFRVNLESIRASGYLSFDEAYDKGWEIIGNSSDESRHVTINGHRNGWYVDPKTFCGTDGNLKKGCKLNDDGSYDIELTIEFTPQRWFYLGLLISGTTLVSCLGYLGYDFVRRRRAARNPA